MSGLDIVLAVLSILGTISSITFAVLAFRRNDRGDHKEAGKNEGVLISDVGYIKSSIDRIEKSIDKLNNLLPSSVYEAANKPDIYTMVFR